MPGIAAAQETSSYTYDALGRLITVTKSGSKNNGVQTTYTYDKAGNRQRVVTTGVTATPSIVDGGCESPSVGSSFAYNPSVNGVSFVSGSGVAGNNSAWGFQAAPEGSQVCFLQSGNGDAGYIDFTVNGLTPGTSYRFTFQASRRPGYAPNPVIVSVGGLQLFSQAPSSNLFSTFTTNPFQAAASSITVRFAATSLQGDTSSAVDAISVIQ